MKTRMTEVFGIKHPIMLAGMAFVSLPKLVAAVSNAGGLGILGAAFMLPDELRENIRQIKDQTDKPYGVNFMPVRMLDRAKQGEGAIIAPSEHELNTAQEKKRVSVTRFCRRLVLYYSRK